MYVVLYIIKHNESIFYELALNVYMVIVTILCTHGHAQSERLLQVSAGEDSKLFESLQKLVSADGESDQQFQLQCCLRLLFSQHTE